MKRHNSDSLVVKITLLLTSSLTVMAGATIAPSLPAMQEHFADVNHVEYLVKLALTIPALFIAISGPIVGYLIDRIGRKPLLTSSTLLFACAGSEGFLLDSLWGIIISRALLGLSVAGTMTGVMTIISDYYQGHKRAGFMGLQAASMGMGGVIFISLGGIVANFNWRFPFLIYLFALVVLVLISIRDWSYTCKKFCGPGFMMAGDAAGFVDPLFSTGVWLAMNSGSLGAKMLNQALDNPKSEAEFLNTYESAYKNFLGDVLSFVKYFYDAHLLKDAYFGEAQKIVQTDGDWSSRQDFVSLISGLHGLHSLTNRALATATAQK